MSAMGSISKRKKKGWWWHPQGNWWTVKVRVWGQWNWPFRTNRVRLKWHLLPLPSSSKPSRNHWDKTEKKIKHSENTTFNETVNITPKSTEKILWTAQSMSCNVDGSHPQDRWHQQRYSGMPKVKKYKGKYLKDWQPERKFKKLKSSYSYCTSLWNGTRIYKFLSNGDMNVISHIFKKRHQNHFRLTNRTTEQYLQNSKEKNSMPSQTIKASKSSLTIIYLSLKKKKKLIKIWSTKVTQEIK